MATQVIPYKRATTLGAACTYIPETGWPTNLDGITITSDIRDANGRIYSCTVVKTSSTTFKVSLSDTSGWALGTSYWDMRFTYSGVIFFTDTVLFSVSNNITIE
jgi:hypothetical protein